MKRVAIVIGNSNIKKKKIRPKCSAEQGF